MGRTQQLGMFLMAGAALQMLIMLFGVMRRSYLVIALPVLVMTTAASAVAFWVGWTMMNSEPEFAELEEQEGVPAPV